MSVLGAAPALLLVDAAAFMLTPRDSGAPALISAVGLVLVAPIYVAFRTAQSCGTFKMKGVLAAASLLLCWIATYTVWGLWSGRLEQPDDETVIVMIGEMILAITVFAGLMLAYWLVARFLHQRLASKSMSE